VRVSVSRWFALAYVVGAGAVFFWMLAGVSALLDARRPVAQRQVIAPALFAGVGVVLFLVAAIAGFVGWSHVAHL
jgi:hypothetical protein